MNIFYLSRDPRECAEQHCNEHVVKMITEYGQLLSTAHRVLDGTMERRIREGSNRRYEYWVHPDPYRESLFYKASHINNPSAIWVRQSAEHYMYVYELMLWCNREFVFRYQKDDDHLTIRKLKGDLSIPPTALWDHGGFKAPPQCMPEKFKDPDTIQAYRNFYLGEKIEFATYSRRDPPMWFKDAYERRIEA